MVSLVLTCLWLEVYLSCLLKAALRLLRTTQSLCANLHCQLIQGKPKDGENQIVKVHSYEKLPSAASLSLPRPLAKLSKRRLLRVQTRAPEGCLCSPPLTAGDSLPPPPPLILTFLFFLHYFI